MVFNRRFRIVAAVLLGLFLGNGVARAQTVVRPGFNLFSVQQDIDIGRQSSVQVENQLPMVSRPTVTQYVARLGAKLARYAPGAKYPYQFKVVNFSDINAFALPGGYVYIHRGLIERAKTEGELAGVMAHEISHVALRHQTNQVSKAYLAETGVGILGGLFGSKSHSTAGSIMGTVGGVGLNALFLKNSRSAEQQADIVGAQIMAKAGYDPMDMARFFDTLQREAGGNPGKLAQFFSDHPAPANRAARVRKEAALLGPVRGTAPAGDIQVVRAELLRMAPAPTMAQAAKAQTPTATVEASIERPSSQFRVFRERRGFFEMQYPDNWLTYASSTIYGATLAPRGGLAQDQGGRQRVVCAVIVGHYVPFDGVIGASYGDPRGSLYGSNSLEEATSDLVHHIMDANPYLKPVSGSTRRGTVSGENSLSVELSGTPQGGTAERMRVFTRELSDGHVVYVLALAPGGDYVALQPTFDRMVRSLQVDDQMTHD